MERSAETSGGTREVLVTLRSSYAGWLLAKSCPTLMTPRTGAYQVPQFMGFLRQEDRSGVLFPSPGDLPHPRIEPVSPPTLQADSLPLSHRGILKIITCTSTGKAMFRLKMPSIPVSARVVLLHQNERDHDGNRSRWWRGDRLGALPPGAQQNHTVTESRSL